MGKVKDVFTVIERQHPRDAALSLPPEWVRIGVAIKRKDGSLHVFLSALP